VALQEIGVGPSGKLPPDGGMQFDAPTLQLSETVALKETAAPFVRRTQQPDRLDR